MRLYRNDGPFNTETFDFHITPEGVSPGKDRLGAENSRRSLRDKGNAIALYYF